MTEPDGTPTTGDAQVDGILRDLDRALDGTADEVDPVEALTLAHRRLQERLATPTGQVDPPGQARPGPR